MPVRNRYHVYQKVSEMNKNPISEAWILKNPIFDNDHCQDYQIIKSILGNNNKRYDEVHLSIPDQEIFYELHFLLQQQ